MALYVWLNAVSALLAVAAFVVTPLWLTLRYPDRAPDFSAERAYLRAKAEAERGTGAPVTVLPGIATDHRHAAAA